MKLISFSYQKEDGSSPTERNVLAMSMPSDTKYIEGFDFSQIDPDSLGLFLSDYEKLKSALNEELLALMHKYDMKFNYRKFKVSGVSGLQDI